MPIAVTVDTEEAEQVLSELNAKIKSTSKFAVGEIRKAWDTLVVFSYITGDAIDQTYQLMAQAAFIAAETLVALATAETLTVWGAGKAALSFALAYATFLKAVQLRQKGSEVSHEINSIIMLGNLWRFY